MQQTVTCARETVQLFISLFERIADVLRTRNGSVVRARLLTHSPRSASEYPRRSPFAADRLSSTCAGHPRLSVLRCLLRPRRIISRRASLDASPPERFFFYLLILCIYFLFVLLIFLLLLLSILFFLFVIYIFLTCLSLFIYSNRVGAMSYKFSRWQDTKQTRNLSRRRKRT